jgi:hypothetical protein
MFEMTGLPEQIAAHLNNGYAVAAEVAVPIGALRSFVRIRPVPKPGVAREERRYLNSRYDMWQYWNYACRRIVLHSGWEADEWNYDNEKSPGGQMSARGKMAMVTLGGRLMLSAACVVRRSDFVCLGTRGGFVEVGRWPYLISDGSLTKKCEDLRRIPGRPELLQRWLIGILTGR